MIVLYVLLYIMCMCKCFRFEMEAIIIYSDAGHVDGTG